METVKADWNDYIPTKRRRDTLSHGQYLNNRTSKRRKAAKMASKSRKTNRRSK